MRTYALGLLLASSVACSGSPKTPPAAENGYGESVSPGEEALDREIAALSVAVLKKERGSVAGVMTRDVHAKAHGCVRAEFAVDPGLPADLRAGVFSEPGRTYASWIRFSNGASKIQPDKKADARGMAIKLMGVEGEKLLDGEKKAGTQDFLLITHDAFFVKDGKDYADFFRRLERGSNPAWFFFGRLPWRWKEFRAASRLVSRGKAMLSPLDGPYFSATPYLLGERNVVKYSARPCEPRAARPNASAGSPDYLRLNMARALDPKEGAPACLRFLVQRRTEPAAMSVEDSRVAWDEARSPFIPVATITIPAQSFDGEKRTRFCENLSFTPWHSLPAHRPLGGVNRTRKAVYEAVSAFRHEANGETRREPEAGEAP